MAARGSTGLLLALVIAHAAAGCGSDGKEPAAATETAPLFVDATAASGIEFRLENGASGKRYFVETAVGGVGWIDYDNDGDCDLYLVNAHSDPLNAAEAGKEPDRLYRNDGGGRFSDVTEESGVGDPRYGFGVAVGDYDNDGDRDLLVTNYGRNTLYENRGDGTFRDVTEEAGLVERGWSTSATWFDADADGDLDLYIARYLRYDPKTSRACRHGDLYAYCDPRHFPGERDLFYRNLGGGRFAEESERAGITLGPEHEGKGLGVVAFDFDRDGDVDVFVANDTTPNLLYVNRGDGTFDERGLELSAALSAEGKAQAGMGVDVADVDGDGRSDIYVTNFSMELNSLYMAREDGSFEERSRASGLAATYAPLGFGTLFLDADLDGDPDILTVNGHVDDIVEKTDPASGATYRQRPDLFWNDGRGFFSRAEPAARSADDRTAAGEFFTELFVGRGLAAADYDLDGDVDVATLGIDRSLVLLESEASRRGASVTIELVGARGARDAYGATVEVECAGRRQFFEYASSRSYLSACDPRIVVGLGRATRVDRIRVRWPGGRVTEAGGAPAGARVTLREE